MLVEFYYIVDIINSDKILYMISPEDCVPSLDDGVDGVHHPVGGGEVGLHHHGLGLAAAGVWGDLDPASPEHGGADLHPAPAEPLAGQDPRHRSVLM